MLPVLSSPVDGDQLVRVPLALVTPSWVFKAQIGPIGLTIDAPVAYDPLVPAHHARKREQRGFIRR